MADLNSVFEKHTNITFDRKFYANVLEYVNNFLTKNTHTIEFFGGNLIGVHAIRWTPSELLTWTDEVLGIDNTLELEGEIGELEGVNPDFRVSSNVVNLSFIWCIHRALSSGALNDKDKVGLANTLLNMLQYKFVTSIHVRNFGKGANMDIAIATYESLSYKPLLKKLGTWGAVVDYMSKETLNPKGIYYNAIYTFDDDYDIVKVLNALWNRIKSMMKTITARYHDIYNGTFRYGSNDGTISIEGTAVFKDRVADIKIIQQRMRDVTPDRNSFVQDELMTAILEISKKAQLPFLQSVLYEISNTYNEDDFVSEYIDNIIRYEYDFIVDKKIPLKNVTLIISRLYGMLGSSRVKGELIMDIKNDSRDIISRAIPKMNTAKKPGLVTAMVLYIMLRSLIKG